MLVVDVQRGLVTGAQAVADADSFVTRLGGLLWRARDAAVPVIHVQDDGTDPGSPIRRGGPGWELVLEVGIDETVIHKSEDDAFRGTDLHDVLQGARADRLVVVGIQSEMCVAATAHGALDRGYAVVLPRDGHTTYDVPADDRGGIAVPAQHASRVAEWSLGDTIEVPASVDEVDFHIVTR